MNRLEEWKMQLEATNLVLETKYRSNIRNTYRTYYTDKKEKKIFLVYKEIQNGAVAKSYTQLTASSYMENICTFPHKLGSPSSYMTLQLRHSEFLYIWGKLDFLWFSFLSVYTVPSPLYVAVQDTLHHDDDKRTSTTQTQCCSFDFGSGSRISSKFRSYIWIHADPDSGPWILLTKTVKSQFYSFKKYVGPCWIKIG